MKNKKKEKGKNETVEYDNYGLLSEYHVGCFPGNRIQGNVPQSPKFRSEPCCWQQCFKLHIFNQVLEIQEKSFLRNAQNWSLQVANQIGEAIYLTQCQRIAWKSSQRWQTHKQSGTSLFILNAILNLGRGITINMAKDHKTRTRTANTVRIQIKHPGLHQFYYHSFYQLRYLKNPSQQTMQTSNPIRTVRIVTTTREIRLQQHGGILWKNNIMVPRKHQILQWKVYSNMLRFPTLQMPHFIAKNHHPTTVESATGRY